MILLTIVVAAISLLYFYFTRNFYYWKDRNVPGPKPVPFYGNLLKSTLRYVAIGDTFKEIYDSYPTEKVVGVFRMTTPCLMIRDLEIVKHIMIKDFDNFVDRGIAFSREGLGANLFHSDGETWRTLRSRFSPIFTNQKLKNMMYLLDDRAEKFVDYIREITAKNAEHDVHALMKKYTISTISACAFGIDIDTFRGDIEVLKKVDKNIFNKNFGIELDMMYQGIFLKLNMSLFPKYIENFFKELVENVITQRNGVPSNRKDFMDLILELKNKKEIKGSKGSGDDDPKALEVTNSMIEAQAFVFYAAGYETSASTMGFMLYHLAMDPEIQTKLQIEIDEYLQRYEGRIELDTLNELTYLDQVFSETLRMYPIVDILQRRAQSDYECPNTKVTVAKDQIVIVSSLGIHRDEKYYPDPEKFNPNHFSSEKVAARHPCAYMPFGLGPRHCIGIRFAHVQTRVCIIRLLSKFRVETGINTAKSFSFSPHRVVLAPKEPLYVNLFPREDLACKNLN